MDCRRSEVCCCIWHPGESARIEIADLSPYSQGLLDAVADEPDDRPRKILNWAKPTEKIIRLFNTVLYAQ